MPAPLKVTIARPVQGGPTIIQGTPIACEVKVERTGPEAVEWPKVVRIDFRRGDGASGGSHAIPAGENAAKECLYSKRIVAPPAAGRYVMEVTAELGDGRKATGKVNVTVVD